MSRPAAAAATQRRVLGLLLAALPLLGGLLLAGLVLVGGCGREPPLTILLISLDTTRPDHLSAYGYDRATTPTLARLAREGAVFTNARSTSSWTLPAHMSLFTGLPPGLHDVVIDFQTLDQGRRTLGEVFKGGGFETAGFYSAPYVHGKYGFARGMDYYERCTLEPMVFDLPPGQQRAQLGVREHIGHREVTSRHVTDRALNWLDFGDAPRRLCFLHYFDAHYDYMAPAQITARFVDRGYRGPITGENSGAVAPTLGEHPDATDVAQLEGYYDAELAWIDENLARLLARQEQRGELEQTLVVVVADHGEEFFEHGRFGHRFGLYDEVLRIPLIVWAPGRVPPGRVIEDDVSIIDVLPTLLDYAGMPPQPAIEGRSLRPLIDGGRLPPLPVTAALTFIPPAPKEWELAPDGTRLGEYSLHEAFVLDGLKLVRSVQVPWSPDHERDISQAPDSASERFQVFDLEADPGETRDLVAAGDPRVAEIVEAFESERQRQRERLMSFQPAGPGVPITDLSILESMQATGYIQRGN